MKFLTSYCIGITIRMHSSNKVVSQLLGLPQSVEMPEMRHVKAALERVGVAEQAAGLHAHGKANFLPAIHPHTNLLPPL